MTETVSRSSLPSEHELAPGASSTAPVTTDRRQNPGPPHEGFVIEALPPARLEAIRSAAVDDGGNRIGAAFEAEGGEPLRCCLRLARPGEALLLIAYRPFEAAGPYAETGPVYVHAAACAGYGADAGYPEEFRERPQVFRCYDAAGAILGGRVALPPETPEAVIGELFADDRVELIHTRNVVFGCYMLGIRRAR